MLNILLVADIVYYREGLEARLRSCPELVVVDSVASHAVGAVLSAGILPDVVLLDVGSSGARAALALLRSLDAAPKVVALAGVDRPERIVDWVEAGVVAYIPDTASLDEMLNILRAICRGETHCPPQVIQAAFLRLAALAGATRLHTALDVELTRRESEIVQLLECGQSNKVIARKLGISDATAKNHVHRILEKFKLQSRAEVASHVALLRQSGRLRVGRWPRPSEPAAGGFAGIHR